MAEFDIHLITIAGFLIVTFVFAIVLGLTWRMFKRFSERVMASNNNLSVQNKKMRDKIDLVISYRIGREVSNKLKADISELIPLMVAITNDERSLDDVRKMLASLVDTHTRKKKTSTDAE